MRNELRYFALGYVIGGVTLLLCMLITLVAHADQEPRYKIAVIDSGYDPSRANVATNLCKTGHYDFFTRTANVNWYHPHGTKVIDVLSERLKDIDYCLIILQVYTITRPDGPYTDANDVAKAINDAVGLGVTAINISMSGAQYSSAEATALKNAEKVYLPIFISAGNKSKNLNAHCDTYPACYENKNILVVGMQDSEEPKKHSRVSNYGTKVKIWARGDYRMGEETEWTSGTSFAAPRALAEYILFLEHKRLQGAHKHK